MAQVLVRDLDDDVKALLRRRAAANSRAMEAEARAILTDTLRPRLSLGEAWLAMASEVRDELGGVDLALPHHMPSREVPVW